MPFVLVLKRWYRRDKAIGSRLVSVAKRLGLGYRSKLCRWIGHKMRESAGTGKLGTDDFWVGLDIARRLSA